MFLSKLPSGFASVICAVALGFAGWGVAAAQTLLFSSGAASSVPQPLFMVPAGNSGAGQSGASAAKPSLGAIGTGWTYLYADQGGGERESLNGWYLRPSFNLPKGLSVFFDSTNYYGANRKGSENGHGFTFGLAKGFLAKAKVRPSIFAESGVVRTSNAGKIVDQFDLAAGASLAIALNRHVDLTLTPAEWVFLYPNGEARNDYNAKVGLSFPFGHR